MEIKKISNAEYFRTNLIMYWSFILGVIMANVVIVFMFLKETVANMFSEINFLVAIIALALTVICIFLSRAFFKKRLDTIQLNPVLAEKMALYRVALVIKYAFLELPAFVCLILFAFSNEVLLMGITLVIIGYYISERPTRQKCYTNLCLNESEKMQLDDPDARICEMKLQ